MVSAVVTDSLPSTLLNATWTCVASSGASCAASGTGNINEAINLAVGATATYTLNATIRPTATGTLTNSATINPPSGTSDPVLTNNNPGDTDTLTPRASVSVVKTDNVTTAVPGSIVTYTITVTNVGPSGAPGVLLDDVLPSTLRSTTWSCTADATSSCTAPSGSGSVATTVNVGASGSVVFTVSGQIDAAATGSLVNTATITMPPTVADIDLTDNESTDSDTLVPTADIAITKTDNLAPAGVVAGGQVTYTIRATNNGPSVANGLTINDALPSTLSAATWTCSATSGSTCASPSGTGSILANVDLLPSGVARFTLTATLATTALGNLVNTASVTYPIALTDPTPGPTTATDTLLILVRADLGVSKTNGVTTLTPSMPTTYTIVVTNDGPSSVVGASVVDNLPSTLMNATWSCAAGSGASCGTPSGSGSVSTTVDLASGSSATFTVNATVDQAALPGALSNTATIDTPSGTSDPTPTNNSATDTDTVVPVVDLAVTKTDFKTTAVAGSQTSYTITVTNAGPSAVVGASIVDTFGTKLLNATWTCSVSPSTTPNSCSAASGTGNVNSPVTLASGAAATFTIDATVNPAFRGVLTNTATATVPNGVDDSNSANNSAIDTTTIAAVMDIAVSKNNGSTDSSPGDYVTYTVVVSNGGPSTATSVRVVDALALQFANVTWTCTATAGASCPNSSGAGSVDETIAAIGPNESTTYRIRAQITPSSRGTVTNTATGGGDEVDSDLTNNTATDTDTLTPKADLRVVKTDDSETQVPGLPVTYTISVYNDGPSDVTGATVTDVMPAILEGVTWTCATPAGGRCTDAAGSGDIVTDVDLKANTRATFVVKATISSKAVGELKNTASVTTPDGINDPNPTNNTGRDTSELKPTANLRVEKTDNSETAIPGEEVVYVITVYNDGPSAAPNALLDDFAPPSLSKISWVCQASLGAICAGGGNNTLKAFNISLPANSSASVVYKSLIDPTATGVLKNTAVINGGPGFTETNPSDNTAVDESKLTPKFDLAITKDDGVTTVTSGKTASYKIVVTSQGPSASGPIKISDIIPRELINATWNCAGPTTSTCSSPTGKGNVDVDVSLLANDSATITLNVEVDPDTEVATIKNTVTATPGPDTIDPTPGPTEASDTDEVIAETDVSVVKTHIGGEIVAGSEIAYSIVVSNAGPSTARKVKVTDTLSADLLDATWTCTASAGSSCPASGSGSIDAEVTVKPDSPMTFTLKATVRPDMVGELANTATVTFGPGTKDLNAGNNTSTDKVVPIHRGDVSIEKTDGRDYVIQGRYNTYGITVSNVGPSAVRGVLVNDQMPRDFNEVEWTCETVSGSATCSVPSGSGDITNVAVDLGANSSVMFIVRGRVDKDAVTAMTNSASVSIPADFIDTNAANNSDKDTDRMWDEWLTNPPKDNPKGSLTKSAPKAKAPAATTAATKKPVNSGLGDPSKIGGEVASSNADNGDLVLALTGADSENVAETAMLLVLIGGFLLLLVRRRTYDLVPVCVDSDDDPTCRWHDRLLKKRD